MKAKWLVLAVVMLLLAACQQTAKSTWITYHSDEGRFSVLMPGTPHEETTTLSGEADGTVRLTADLDWKDANFAVICVDLPQALVGNSAPGVIMAALSSSIMNAEEDSLINVSSVSLGEHSVSEVKFRRGSNRVVTARIHLVGTRAYWATVDVPADEDEAYAEDVSRFLDSFTVDE